MAIDHEAMWGVLRRFADTLVRSYDLEEVLVRLGEDIVQVLGVAGAGAMIEDPDGKLRFFSTSDPVLKELEALQLEYDEGPCLLAFRTGTQVIAADLAADTRFERFAAEALRAGMRAVYSFPMRIDDTVFGALNLYDTEPGHEAVPTLRWLAVGQTFADVATSYLANARDLAQKDVLSAQLTEALDRRVVLEQAKGFVMARRGVSSQEAFELLRRYARTRRIQVRAIARAIVHGDLDVDDLLK